MRLPVLFLFVTVLIDAMGIGLIVPVMPDLLREVASTEVSRAALWGGVLSTLYALMQFLFAPLLGALSDRIGRRPVLLGTLAIMVADYVIMALTHSLPVLLIARTIGGMAGATMATANAAMADLSPPDKRAQGFGLIGAAFGLGFVLGPLIGGFLGEFGTRAPFVAAAVLSGLNLLLGILAFRETARPAPRPLTWRDANPFGAFRALARDPEHAPLLIRGMAIFFLYHMAFTVYPAVWAFFGQARFDWSAGMIGLSLALFGGAMAVVQGGAIRLFLRWRGEAGTVSFGLACAALAYLVTAFNPWSGLMLALTPLAALGGVFSPALQAILSRALPADRQGALQGVLSATAAIASVIAPLAMTATFAVFTAPERAQPFAGAPFLLACVLVSGALALFLTRPR